MTKTVRPLAVVFGGSRGIGTACVDALVRDGFDVAFTYVAQAKVAQEIMHRHQLSGAKVIGYHLDITDAEEVNALFAKSAINFGVPVNAVIVNAGINVPPAHLAEFEDTAFRQLVEVNLFGAFNVLKAAARVVVNGGAIVALTTSLVRHALAGIGPYSATKAAVECLVRSLAKELAPRQIRVNGVAPGPVDTDLFNNGKSDQAKQRSAALSPLNRIAAPHEIAEVVSFLVSSKASWIDGQIVQVNGALV